VNLHEDAIVISADTFVEGDEEELIDVLKSVLERHQSPWYPFTDYTSTDLPR
jgi:hypothetical protein